MRRTDSTVSTRGRNFDDGPARGYKLSVSLESSKGSLVHDPGNLSLTEWAVRKIMHREQRTAKKHASNAAIQPGVLDL